MNDLQQIEVSIESAKEVIALLDTFKRLENNKDFNKIILDGYFKDEASRLVLLKSDPSMDDDKSQKALDNAIISVGGLRQYFSQIYQMGMIAERSLEQDIATQTELMSEE